MLDLTQLLPFTLASLVIILSPGADSFVLLRIAHSRGVKAGMSALWGINVGNTTQALLMISGVGLLVSKNETAILVLKILGAIYMTYLALQAARARRGRRPLYRYHVLKLAGRWITSHAEGGGSHASPAMHLRRGHVRRLPHGGFTWVNAHVVGKPKDGVLMKDYDARALA